MSTRIDALRAKAPRGHHVWIVALNDGRFSPRCSCGFQMAVGRAESMTMAEDILTDHLEAATPQPGDVA